MSILLYASRPVEKVELRSKHAEPKTSSILLISVAIFMSVVLLMYVGLLFTESSMKAYSTCRDKIVGYERGGTWMSASSVLVDPSYSRVVTAPTIKYGRVSVKTSHLDYRFRETMTSARRNIIIRRMVKKSSWLLAN